MTVTLTAELERVVADLMAHGYGSSPDDVVRRGLEVLRVVLTSIHQADRGELKPFNPIGRLAELRKDVQAGIEQMRQGRVTSVDHIGLLDEVDREDAEKNEPRSSPLNLADPVSHQEPRTYQTSSFLQRMLKWPVLYTSHGEFDELVAFLDGFCEGTSTAECQPTDAEEVNRFLDWLHAGWSKGQYRWNHIISMNCPTSKAAFQRIRDLYERFRTESEVTPDCLRPSGQ
jgi:hypothetical protein